MARAWKPRQAPSQTSTVTAVAQLYHASAAALAKSLGLSVQEVLDRYHTAASAVFIECCKRDLRLPDGVKLPMLAAPGHPPPAAGTINGHDGHDDPHDDHDDPHDDPLPTTIPVGQELPCGGALIVDLQPAQLAMLIAKAKTKAESKGGAWTTLLQALQAERQARLARGRHRAAREPGEEG